MATDCSCVTVVISEPPPQTIISQPPQPATVVISPAEQGPAGGGIPGEQGIQGEQGIPGVALVQSVFGRVDVVVAAAGDYAIDDITGLTTAGDGTKFLADDGIFKTTSGGVTAFNGRTGAITPLAGDYALAQITGLLDGGTGANVLTDDGSYDPTASSFNGRTGGVIPTAGDYGIAMIAGMTVSGGGTQPLMDDGVYRPIVEAHVTDLDRVRWEGTWADGTYLLNDAVHDDKWLMVANKTTTDRAAPQPAGSPAWRGLGDSPAWASKQDTETQIAYGQRYTWGQAGYVSGIRIWVPVDNSLITYQVFLVTDPLGTPITETILSATYMSTIGWNQVASTLEVVPSGSVFDIVVVVKSNTGETTWNANYDYVRGAGNPTAGEIRDANNAANLLTSYTDDDTTDRTAALQALVVGDTLTFNNVTYTIEATTNDTGFQDLNCVPKSRTDAGVHNVVFRSTAPTPIDYVDITDHYLSDVNVRGFYSDIGYSGGVVLDDNAYGVDIEVQPAIVSPDWDVMVHGN